MKKRIGSLFLALALCLSLMPMTVLAEDAHPAGRLPAERPFRQKIGANGRRNSQHRTDELPGGQAKENRLAVLADFFWYLDLHGYSLLSKCVSN